VSDAVITARDESVRAVRALPTGDISESVTKMAVASSEEISRCSSYVKKETDKLTNSLESATRCQVCDKHISTTLAVTKIKELRRCSVCGLRCCSDCSRHSKEEIPDHLWHPDVEKSSSRLGPYCVTFCQPKLFNFWLTRSCSMLRQDFYDTLDLYLQFASVEKISKPFATKDGHYRKGQRILTLANYVASVTGYQQYIKIITVLAQGHGIYSLLLANDYVSLLYPLLEMLEGFGVKGPEGLLRVWYYACHCELQRKMDVDFERGRGAHTQTPESRAPRGQGQVLDNQEQDEQEQQNEQQQDEQEQQEQNEQQQDEQEQQEQDEQQQDEQEQPKKDEAGGGQEGRVLAEQCPQALLDYAGSYMGPAQWLYSAMGLPSPHESDEWSRWYLSRLVGVQGWSLLACSMDATEHYGFKCPAFALVARQTSGGGKEALLVIRGSSTVVDWKINMSDDLSDFTYWSGTGRRGDGPLRAVRGQVHSGMLGGVHKILDLFGMRVCLTRLLEAGFDLKIVGHSLGASTACLLAAEIKNGYAEVFNQKEEAKGVENEDDEVVAFSGNIPHVPAVGFGCPPCVDAVLADALSADDMFIGVVHRDDLVPRLSRYALHCLADEVAAYAEEAGRLRREDTESLKTYAVTYGLAHDMSEKAGVEMKDVTGNEEEVKDEQQEEQVEKKEVTPPSPPLSEDTAKSFWKRAERVLVLPGKIIHLTFSRGGYQARLCDHRLATFSEIIPIQSAVHNHYMRAHIEAMRSLRLSTSNIRKRPPPPWEPIFDSNVPNGGAWARCHVCDSDPCWPYITRSDAARAMAVHNCRACGHVVCSVCAPAADRIPADGIGKYKTLRDQSMSLPFMGLTDKQRVCTPCYLHCYERILVDDPTADPHGSPPRPPAS